MKCCISVEKKRKKREIAAAYGDGRKQKINGAYRSGRRQKSTQERMEADEGRRVHRSVWKRMKVEERTGAYGSG